MARTFTVDPADVEQALTSLRALLAAADTGEIAADAEQLAHVRGGIEALEALLQG